MSKLIDTWENVFRNQEWGKYPAEPLIRFIANNYYNEVRKNVKILEIGCGTGANLWFIAREGFKAFGIDISSTAIEKADSRIKKEGLSADLFVGNIEKLPFEQNYFDCVIDNECLYCNPITAAENILKEIKRVLRKGGLFFSRTFTDRMSLGKSNNKINEFEYDGISDGVFAGKGHVRLIDREGIKKLYGSYLEIISIDNLEYTYKNGNEKVCEWVIECKKPNM